MAQNHQGMERLVPEGNPVDAGVLGRAEIRSMHQAVD